MMINDHGAANNDLKTIAREKNVTLPDNLGKHQNI
jgi:predicted outer membrane protein